HAFRRSRRHFARATAAALVGRAGGGESAPGGGGGGGGGGKCKTPPPATVSYSMNIQPIYNRSCATSSACHVGPTAGQGLQLTEGVSYGATVNVPSTEMPKLLLVKPGNADDSYLVRKIEGGPNISGLQMPQGCPGTPSGGAVCLSADDIAAIRTGVTECPQTTCPPSSSPRRCSRSAPASPGRSPTSPSGPGPSAATAIPTSTAAGSGRRSPRSTPTTSSTTCRSCHCRTACGASTANCTRACRSPATRAPAARPPASPRPTPHGGSPHTAPSTAA